MEMFQKDLLVVKIYDSRAEMGLEAAKEAAAVIRNLQREKEYVRIIFAAAPSQNEFLAGLAADQSIDFSRIDAFHMDEYIGLPKEAPQGFGNFLKAHIFDLREFHSVTYLNGQNPDPEEECERYTELLQEKPIDIVLMGVGENGHIAFNDPPVADFNDPKAVKIVKLDEICRMQQVHDGCFKTIDDVPTHALSLTVPTLCTPPYRFCVVPAATKANAVKHMLEDEIDEHCPCTVLRRTPGSFLYLDPDSSALYKEKA